MFRIFARVVLILAVFLPVLSAVDQVPLQYTALLGTGAAISAVAVDSTGAAYIAGSASAALPVTPGAFSSQFNPTQCQVHNGAPGGVGPCDMAFAAKLTPDGTGLLYLTYLGMRGSSAAGISLDAQGDAWITGGVSSSDLAVTANALQSKVGSSFVLELNSTGSQLLYASYFGGTANSYVSSYVSAQTRDASGNLYLTGGTYSSDFPVSADAFQSAPNAEGTTFVSKLDPTGKLIYATYFPVPILALAADAAGEVYLTGSTEGVFSVPTTPGAFQTTATGTSAFVSKLNATGSALEYSTYLAGANSEVTGVAIAVDSQGDAYVTGTIEPGNTNQATNFPVTPGAFQTTAPAIPSDIGFVTKLNPDGTALVYSTLLAAGQVTGLALNSSGDAIVIGIVGAYNFPTTPGALMQCLTSYANGPGFLLQLSADGSQALYSTYLALAAGSTGAVAVDSTGEIYVGGPNAQGLPIVPGSYGWTDSGISSFLAKLTPEPLPAGSLNCIVNDASQISGYIAPGEVVDLYGIGIGPATSMTASVVSGQIPTTLGGVQVLIDGTPAPILSAGPNQIRAIVPFEVAYYYSGLLSPDVDVQVLSPTAAVTPLTVAVVPAAPGIYTVPNTAGFALTINQDGTLNSPQNPAPQGSVVTFYVTGLNNTQPALTDGAIATAAAPLALASAIQVSLLSTSSRILYAGTAPGDVAGVTQINLFIPVSQEHGPSPFVLTVSGGVEKQPWFTGATSQTVYFYQQ
jgi:uncharacterized protein (TIGR03437 family)